MVQTEDPARRRSVVYLVLAALIWSSGGLLMKLVPWPPFAVGGVRGLIAGLFLLCVCWRRLHFTFSGIQIATALAYTGCTCLFAAATKLTTAANAILLQYTAPVWIAVFAAFILGERTTGRDWLFIAVMLIGMGAFFYDGLRFGDMAGILLAIASGISFALMIVLMRKQKDIVAIEPVILGNFAGFLIGLPATLSMHGWPSTRSLLTMLVLGVGQLGISYLLYTRAIRHVTALEGALIPMIEPILNPVWVMLAIGERPSAVALGGGVLVLGSVALRILTGLRRVAV